MTPKRPDPDTDLRMPDIAHDPIRLAARRIAITIGIPLAGLFLAAAASYLIDDDIKEAGAAVLIKITNPTRPAP